LFLHLDCWCNQVRSAAGAAGQNQNYAQTKGHSKALRIAVFGAGCIGSMMAWHLVRDGGHEVTVVARGARLVQLQTDHAILDKLQNRAEITVNAALDLSVPYDLLLVPVKGNQVAEALHTVQGSAARTIMFMSVTFRSLGLIRDAVGAARFAYGFPKFPAVMKDGILEDTKISSFTPVIVTEPRWAKLFKDAHIPSGLTHDMDSYLRAHVAAATPLLTLCVIRHKRGAGITCAEATSHAKVSTLKPWVHLDCSICLHGMVPHLCLQTHHHLHISCVQAQAEGFAIVRQLGHKIPNAGLNWMSHTPLRFNSGVFWLMSRMLPSSFQELLSTSDKEAADNIDEMSNAAPGKTAALQTIRPVT